MYGNKLVTESFTISSIDSSQRNVESWVGLETLNVYLYWHASPNKDMPTLKSPYLLILVKEFINWKFSKKIHENIWAIFIQTNRSIDCILGVFFLEYIVYIPISRSDRKKWINKYFKKIDTCKQTLEFKCMWINILTDFKCEFNIPDINAEINNNKFKEILYC